MKLIRVSGTVLNPVKKADDFDSVNRELVETMTIISNLENKAKRIYLYALKENNAGAVTWAMKATKYCKDLQKGI